MVSCTIKDSVIASIYIFFVSCLGSPRVVTLGLDVWLCSYTGLTSQYYTSSYQCDRVRMKELADPLFLGVTLHVQRLFSQHIHVVTIFTSSIQLC